MGLLDIGPFHTTRRNHGLEHATIHVLTEKFPQLALAGRADAGGFFILGDIATEEIAPAVEQALERVRGGEHGLVVHPRCGTNLVVAGMLAGLSSFAVAGGRRDENMWEKLPRMILATTTAIILAQPLGPLVQEKWTTSHNFAGAWLKGIKRRQSGNMTIHRVEISDGPKVA